MIQNGNVVKLRMMLGMIFIALSGCQTLPPTCLDADKNSKPEDFLNIAVSSGDTLESLAKKHLGKESLAWKIEEFNGKNLVPGNNIIVPLKSFKPYGLTDTGYQIVPVLRYESKSLSKADLEWQLKYLSDSNYTVVSIDDFYAFISSGEQLPQKSVLITFDGVNSEFADIAMPLLEKFKYPAALFITTSEVGKKGYLSWDDLKSFPSKNISVQNATKTGQILVSGLNKQGREFERYMDMLADELVSSKEEIEKNVGRSAPYLAYPSGKTHEAIIELLREAYGYKAAFTDKQEDKRDNSIYSEPYMLSRINAAKLSDQAGFGEALKYFTKFDKPIEDGIDFPFHPVPVEEIRAYEEKGLLRKALFHWKVRRDSLLSTSCLESMINGPKSIDEANSEINRLNNEIKTRYGDYMKTGKYAQAFLFDPESRHAVLKLRETAHDYNSVNYTVKEGDTFISVAQNNYGDRAKAKYIHTIREADFRAIKMDVSVDSQLPAGATLRLPNFPPPEKAITRVCGELLGRRTKEEVSDDFYRTGKSAFENEGNTDKALSALKKSVCLNPKNKDAELLLEQVKVFATGLGQ